MTPLSSNCGVPAHEQTEVTEETTHSLGSNYARPIITLIVGGPSIPAQEGAPVKFFVHEPLLLNSSPVFRVMLLQSTADDDENYHDLPTWVEAINREIRLPEDRVEDWGMMCQWLYSGGRKRNVLAACDLVGTDASILGMMREKQPGLEDLELERAVEEYISWRAARDERRRHRPKPYKQQAVSRLELPDLVADTIDAHGKAYWDGDASVQSAELSASKRRSQCSRNNPSLSSEESTNADNARPNPPAFGRLIRLYILADKYAVDSAPLFPSKPDPILLCSPSYDARHEYSQDGRHRGLQRQIILRVRAINKLANAVPDRADVKRLWENIVDERDALREEVLGMYVGMGRRSFEKIFERSLAVQDQGSCGVGDVGTCRWRSEKRFESDENEDEEWHGGFLKELMLRKVLGSV